MTINSEIRRKYVWIYMNMYRSGIIVYMYWVTSILYSRCVLYQNTTDARISCSSLARVESCRFKSVCRVCSSFVSGCIDSN